MSHGLITLYHFTNRPNIELIVQSKTIKAGSYLHKNQLKNGLISLTTDPDPTGHGLTDGREISESQVRQLRYATEFNNKYFCVDNTEFCIKISIQSDLAISASKIHNNNELLLLEKTAYLPCCAQVNQLQLDAIAIQIEKGQLIGKSKTWYYHRGDLSLSQYELLHRSPSGNYCAVPKNATGEPVLTSIPKAPIFEYS